MEIPEGTEKKKLLSRWDRVFLWICALIIIYIALQQMGVNLLHQTDETELIENPHRN